MTDQLMKMTESWTIHEVPGASRLPSLQLNALGYFQRKKEAVRTAFHFSALALILEGHGYFRHKTRKIKITAPAYFFVGPPAYSDYGPLPGGWWQERYLIFTGPRADEWRKAGWIDPTCAWPLPRPQAWIQLHESLRDALQNNATATLDRLKLEFERSILDLHLTRSAKAPPSRPHLFRNLVDTWRTQRSLSIHLPTAARDCGLSYSRFRSEFRKHMGTSPYQTLLEIRLEGAAQTLASTTTPVKEIAYHYGFHHAEPFHRAFRQHFHMTPLEYRRDHSPTLA